MLVDEITYNRIQKLTREYNLTERELVRKIERYCRQKMFDIIQKNNCDVKKIVAELKAIGAKRVFANERGMEAFGCIDMECLFPFADGEIDNLPVYGLQPLVIKIREKSRKDYADVFCYGPAYLYGCSYDDLEFESED